MLNMKQYFTALRLFFLIMIYGFYSPFCRGGVLDTSLHLSTSAQYDDNINFVSSDAEPKASHIFSWYMQPALIWETEDSQFKLGSEYYIGFINESDVSNQRFWSVATSWQHYFSEIQQLTLQAQRRYDSRVDANSINRLLSEGVEQNQESDNIKLEWRSFFSELLSTQVEYEYQHVDFQEVIFSDARDYTKHAYQLAVNYHLLTHAQLQSFLFGKQVHYEAHSLLLDSNSLFFSRSMTETDVDQWGAGLGLNYQLDDYLSLSANINAMTAREASANNTVNRESFGGNVNVSLAWSVRSKGQLSIRHRVQPGDFGLERESAIALNYLHRLNIASHVRAGYTWARTEVEFDDRTKDERRRDFHDVMVSYEQLLNDVWTLAFDIQYDAIYDPRMDLQATKHTITTRLTFQW